MDGVYETDPNVNENANKYKKISYDKMLEMANNGAKVLHNKCVKLAKEYNVPITVKSTFLEESEGTLVTGENSVHKFYETISKINQITTAKKV